MKTKSAYWITPLISIALLSVLLFSVACNVSQNRDMALSGSRDSYVLNVYDKFPKVPLPDDNPLTKPGIELGRKLFYDPILSGDSTQSCSSCHMQRFAFGDESRFSKGMDNINGERNSPTIINCAWQPKYFWDGRAVSLEEQAIGPVENPIEMHASWKNVVAKVQRSEIYPSLFQQAFGTNHVTKKLVAKAIAQFERTLLSMNSKYDRVVRGEDTFTEQELRGLNLFFTERADCFHCHGNILFTDQSFHNNGLDKTPQDTGLEKYTGRKRDIGKFKTPTLRNLAFSAPYMHDGRFQTLEEVIDFYSEGLNNSSTIDPLMKNVKKGGVRLTKKEKADLISFLNTLNDTSFITNPAYSNPFENPL